MQPEAKTFVNTLMDDNDHLKKLDVMVKENGSDRAKFIRWLIDKEWDERKRVEKSKKAVLKSETEKADGLS